MRPHLELGDLLTSCLVERIDGHDEIPLVVDVDVHLGVYASDWAGEVFAATDYVALYEGSKLVATGEFL